MILKLNERQQRFAREYIVDCNASQAAIRSGYSVRNCKRVGYGLLQKPWVRAEIERLKKAQTQRLDITADAVLAQIARRAFFDTRKLVDEDGNLIPIHKLDDDTQAALDGFELSTEVDKETGALTVTSKIKLANRDAPLTLLARHLKLLTDKTEVTGRDGGPIHVRADDCSDDELAAIALSGKHDTAS